MKCSNGIWFPDDEQHLIEMTRSSRVIRGRGTYQYNKLEAALSLVKYRRCAVDIGMHVGLWAMHLAQEFRTVIGFEPVQAHIECLRLNMKGLSNYRVYDCALGDRQGEVGLRFLSGSTGSTQIDEGGRGIKMMRLDDFARDFEYVDFIKIDVENYEPFVVEGGERTIRAHKPVIILEQKGVKTGGYKLNYGRGRYAAKEILESWGAKLKFEMKGDCCLSWK